MPKGRSGIITEEFKGKENTAYHDVEKLFKIYRSVNWKMQIKINQVKRHFQLEYGTDLVLIHGIELEYKDEILRVSAPVLIPHRKDCYTDYLYKPLHTAFRNWCMQRAEEKLEIPTYTNCTICFVHVYDETLPLARVRDHDNYEEKHVQDIITNFFLRSDSGLYTNTCHVTRMGEEDRTLLYVMDSSKFPAWISDFGKETGIEKNHE